MPDCECIPGCPFFNDETEAGKSDYYVGMKRHYCLGNNSECARHIVYTELGPGVASNDLLPDQVTEARELIEELL